MKNMRKVTGSHLCSEIPDSTCITIRETGKPGKGARFEMVVLKGIWRQAERIMESRTDNDEK